jgi:hypothetical protein
MAWRCDQRIDEAHIRAAALQIIVLYTIAVLLILWLLLGHLIHRGRPVACPAGRRGRHGLFQLVSGRRLG